MGRLATFNTVLYNCFLTQQRGWKPQTRVERDRLRNRKFLRDLPTRWIRLLTSFLKQRTELVFTPAKELIVRELLEELYQSLRSCTLTETTPLTTLALPSSIATAMPVRTVAEPLLNARKTTYPFFPSILFSRATIESECHWTRGRTRFESGQHCREQHAPSRLFTRKHAPNRFLDPNRQKVSTRLRTTTCASSDG